MTPLEDLLRRIPFTNYMCDILIIVCKYNVDSVKDLFTKWVIIQVFNILKKHKKKK